VRESLAPIKRPWDLNLIAALCLAWGAAGVWFMLDAYRHSVKLLDPSVLLLLVGFGLFKLKKSARWGALAWIYLIYAVLLLRAGTALLAEEAPAVWVPDDKSLPVGRSRIVPICALLVFALPFIWGQRVLSRREVAALFYAPPHQ
jgi:hypothetical protein